MSLLKLPTIEELKQILEERKQEEKEILDKFNKELFDTIEDNIHLLLNGECANLIIYTSVELTLDEKCYRYLKYLVDDLNKGDTYEINISDVITCSKCDEHIKISIKLKHC